jgi:hypothetical protein
MQTQMILLLPAKRFLWCLSLIILMISEVRCGSKCGSAFGGPCVPDALLTASTMQLTFGPQAVGTTSSQMTVTLSATGTSASLISFIAISGDFIQMNTCGKALAPNTSCSIAVVFRPTATGTRTGLLTINEGPSVSILVGLTGTGQ